MAPYAWLLWAGLASGATPPPASPPPAAEASVSELSALLRVRDGGCNGGADSQVPPLPLSSTRLFRQEIWLSLRESVADGPVKLTRNGNRLRAEVITTVEPTEPDQPVAACIRPLDLQLYVSGLPEGDYEVEFVRAPNPN